MTHETSSLHFPSPPAAASSPPKWQWSCSATSASLCPERSCLYPQGTNPTVAIQCQNLCMWQLLQAEMAWLPKWGGELLGWAVQEDPTCPFPLVLAGGAGQAQPAPRADTARATPSQGCPGAENTHGLGHVLWTEHILLPTACTGCKSHFLWCSFSISQSGHVSDGSGKPDEGL